jgi:hypothetical protein
LAARAVLVGAISVAVLVVVAMFIVVVMVVIVMASRVPPLHIPVVPGLRNGHNLPTLALSRHDLVDLATVKPNTFA